MCSRLPIRLCSLTLPYVFMCSLIYVLTLCAHIMCSCAHGYVLIHILKCRGLIHPYFKIPRVDTYPVGEKTQGQGRSCWCRWLSCAQVLMCSCANVLMHSFASAMCSCGHVPSCAHVLMCSFTHSLTSCAHVLMCSQNGAHEKNAKRSRWQRLRSV